MIDVAIIGAGPYGLSLAAHLRARDVQFRIFGSPMQTWLQHMPQGMRLKSEGFASSLSDPDSTFTLGQYCKQEGLPYADLGLPVHLETFCAYGLEFQRKFVPELETRQVTSLRKTAGGFQIRVEGGETLAARRVVVAVGLSYYHHTPDILAALPAEFASHSRCHKTLDQFKGREVAVVGAGSSALDIAALLLQQGAYPHLVARKPEVRFHDPSDPVRPLMERLRYPMTGIGPGWRSLFCTDAPLVFRHLPERTRLKFVRRHLGPAPPWFIKDEVVGKMPFNLGVNISKARVVNNRVSLELMNGAPNPRTLEVDHVIAATGYRVDLRRLAFLESKTFESIQSVEHTPALSANFESTVPGLHFVGTSAANSFGPLLRFAFGAGFAARRLSRHLAKTASRAGGSVG